MGKISDGPLVVKQIKKENSIGKQKQKEVKLSVDIGENDYIIKRKQTQKFLEKGINVRISIQYKGREILHKNLGIELLDRFLKDLGRIGVPILKGRTLAILLTK